jgi:hypothetical protein
MSKTRRRAYPDKFEKAEKTDKKYGKRGNARGKRTDSATGGGRQFKGKQ